MMELVADINKRKFKVQPVSMPAVEPRLPAAAYYFEAAAYAVLFLADYFAELMAEKLERRL
jgi:hypothetical protein